MRPGRVVLLLAVLSVPAFAAENGKGSDPLLARLALDRSGAPVEVKADKLEFDYDQRVLVYEGNVVVEQGDIQLRTQRLTITLGTDKVALRSVVAVGAVELKQGARIATAGRAEFDNQAQTVILSQNAVLRDGPNEVSGESIVVDLARERSVVQGGQGRVRAVLFPPTPKPDKDEP